MAMYDWNHDGKKSGIDDFIEYEIYNDVTGDSSTSNHRSSGKGSMSIFVAILCILSGLGWQTLLYMLLGIDVENVSVLVMIVLWIVFSAMTIGVVEAIRKR